MRNREIKLRKQLHDSLREKYAQGYGKPKHGLKDEHNSTPAIHSTNTYKTYNRAVNKFADWCKEKGIKDMPTAKKHIPEYMDKLNQEGKSAFTQSTVMSGLAKAFGIHTTDINYKLPQRKRSDIIRSRDIAARDRHFAPDKNQELIKFCEATGLRRRELEALRGSQMTVEGKNVFLYIKNGKGGKKRRIEVVGDKKLVYDMCKRAGEGKVFPRVHNGADIHFYRGNYAKAIYHKYARDINTLQKHEKYHCRGDMKGQVFDREAMRIASENLGHNRIDVIASNYLY